jgi:hypothetical protein
LVPVEEVLNVGSWARNRQRLSRYMSANDLAVVVPRFRRSSLSCDNSPPAAGGCSFYDLLHEFVRFRGQ